MTEQPPSPETHVVRMLKAVRTTRNWSQSDLAQQLNVSRRTVQYWERGDVQPPTFLLSSLRELLGDLSGSYA